MKQVHKKIFENIKEKLVKIIITYIFLGVILDFRN